MNHKNLTPFFKDTKPQSICSPCCLEGRETQEEDEEGEKGVDKWQLLRDNGETRSQQVHADLARIHAVDFNLPTIKLSYSEQSNKQRRLASACSKATLPKYLM